MKICYLADAISIHTQRWVKYFADKGHKVHLISLTPLGDGDIGNTELYVLKKFRLQIRILSLLINLLSDVIQVRKLMKKIKPDILHAHYITDYGFWGALSGFHPFVLSAWGSDILVNPRESRILRYFVQFALKRADLITTEGENAIEEMIRLSSDPDKINLILHGVDTRKFSPKDKSLDEEHRAFDSPTVISTRNLTPIYDLETLIRSVPLVLKQIPEVKFIIAGNGAQENYLKDLAKSLNVLDSITFIGQIPHEELPHHLRAANVYVSTSLSDTISESLMEAMACGLAPVVTNVGDNKKWIANGENGFIIPVKRPDLLAEKIIYLLNNEELRQKMGRANWQLIEERVDYKKEMDKMERLYEELIRRSKG